MDSLIEKICRSHFSKAITKSFVITVVMFATLDGFLTVILKNTFILLLSLLTFYLIFVVLAFMKNGTRSNK